MRPVFFFVVNGQKDLEVQKVEKEELLSGLTGWAEEMRECKEFLEKLRFEPLMIPLFPHTTAGFLETAAEYIETNLNQIANRIRMS